MNSFNSKALSIEEVKEMAQQFVRENPPPQIVLLDGPMGAGKTQWVRFAVEACGGQDSVCSPSFAIHNRYCAGSVFIDHLDLYRLKDAQDLESTGFWDLFSSPDVGYIFIEWGSRLNKESFPTTFLVHKIEFNIVDETKRKLSISRI